MKYDICGIGNACMDIVADVGFDFLARHGIKKSYCTYVSLLELQNLILLLPQVLSVPGGSAANTIHGIGALGGKTAFIGKIGQDTAGEEFRRAMIAEDIFCQLAATAELPSTQVLCLNTPDGDRTFVSLKGAAESFSKGDIDTALIKNSRLLLFDGYTLYSPLALEAFQQTLSIIKQSDGISVFNPGNLSVIAACRDEVSYMMDTADVTICNLEEAQDIFGFTSLAQAGSKLADKKMAGAVTDGANGAILFKNGEILHMPPPRIELQNIDSNGAGDHFAAGFLYGLLNDLTLPKMGQLAELCALDCLSHKGARPQNSLKHLLSKLEQI